MQYNVTAKYTMQLARYRTYIWLNVWCISGDRLAFFVD